MSPTKKKDAGAEKPQYEPSTQGGLMTPAQFQDFASFFFKLGESRTARWLATLAALGAMLGGLHILWLAFLWVYGRLPR